MDRVIDMPAPAPDSRESPATSETRGGDRLLLHICCAPCSTYTVRRLRQIGFDVSGFWYNPNIHPWQEHERRRECLVDYAGQLELPMVWQPGYEMPEFLRRVGGREAFRQRCAICYEMRLTEAARLARAGGYAAFTTTLLISPYQEQGLIREIGEDAGRAAGVAFFFENFRQGWAERGRLSKAFNLYHQSYCGCLYSEWERYRPKGDGA